MFDVIVIPTSLHVTVGVLVMLTTLAATVVSGWLAVRKVPLNSLARWTMILAQIVLALQVLIGIKLLDQGLGVLQLYVHYIGGLGPLFFYLLMYWFPARQPVRQTRVAFLVSLLGFLFAIQAFFIGRAYVSG